MFSQKKMCLEDHGEVVRFGAEIDKYRTARDFGAGKQDHRKEAGYPVQAARLRSSALYSGNSGGKRRKTGLTGALRDSDRKRYGKNADGNWRHLLCVDDASTRAVSSEQNGYGSLKSRLRERRPLSPSLSDTHR